MSPESPSPSSPALAAFLRGVERRAAVLAELQCGDAATGDQALARAMVEFQLDASAEDPDAGQVMAGWPVRFWGQLLARPELLGHVPVRVELSPTDRLGALGAAPRAALLLSLAGGLEQDVAAQVMGVTTSSYELAVRRALAALAGSEEQAALATQWRQLREQVHHRIKNLPPERQRFLAQARAQALAARGDPVPAPADEGPAARPRWLAPALWGLLLVCVLAFLATFFGAGLRARLAGPADGEIWSGSLDAGEEPASRYDRGVEVLTHRDFELLADPQGMEDAEELAFHSWLAAQGVSAATPGAEPGLARAEGAAPAAGEDVAAGEAGGGEELPGETMHEPR